MKLDLTKIEGYENMTPEEKLKALEGYDVPDPDYSGYVKKDMYDKTASELAEKKKQLHNKLTEDEAAKQQEQEEREELQSKYNKLLHESEVSKFKAKLLGMGYDENLADETAEAMVSGDMEKVFANQKNHIDAVEKKVRAEVLKNTPKPVGDSSTGAVDYRKEIEEAQKNGDMSAAAYYTRLAAQESTAQ